MTYKGNRYSRHVGGSCSETASDEALLHRLPLTPNNFPHYLESTLTRLLLLTPLSSSFLFPSLEMPSKSILLLPIFLIVVATKVSSHDEDLKIVVNYLKPPVATPPVKPPPIPVVTVPPPPLPVKPTPPIVKAPPSPPVKPPPTPSPPPVKSPATPYPPPPPLVKPTPSPPVKPPTTPPVKPTPPIVKAPPTTPSPPSGKYSPPPPPPKPPVVVKPPTTPVAPSPPPAPRVKSNKDCIPLCGYRCQLHSRKQVCVRACVTCCERCKCVPPGTYGNREKCGKCYTDMLTHGNRPKCP
ncbi:hypothetical protein RIF29_18831 [Crotalaria pallida]|uniref:Gibberellin-regulated protein 14 n=1 Tax=Crotalaria pallida TaxID=3830 RepID=A0AAN9EYF3_CROPI